MFTVCLQVGLVIYVVNAGPVFSHTYLAIDASTCGINVSLPVVYTVLVCHGFRVYVDDLPVL